MLRTYQSALRRASGESASARKLHETPEIVLRSIPASAREPVKVGHVPSTKGLLDMTSLASAEATDTKPATTSSLPFKLAIVLALAALADVLFYDARIGLSLAIFAIAVAGGSWMANRTTLDRQRVLIGGIVVLLGLVPVIEDVNTVSVLLVVMALALALLLATNPDTTGLATRQRLVIRADDLQVHPRQWAADRLCLVVLARPRHGDRATLGRSIAHIKERGYALLDGAPHVDRNS